MSTKTPVYMRVLTQIQPAFASRVNPDCNPDYNPDYIHWSIETWFEKCVEPGLEHTAQERFHCNSYSPEGLSFSIVGLDL